MSWFDRFRRQPPETRASATDVLVSAIQTAAAGISTENASAIAALEVAAGMWSRAFAAATVKPQTLATRAITPAIMASIGRQLVMRGQSLHALMVERGQVRLDPVGYWEIKGDSPNEDNWIVRCEFYGPTGSYSKILSHSNIVNCRYSCLPSQPSRGLSMMDFAAATGRLAGSIEQRLSDEAGGPSGYLIPVPEDPGGGNTESDSLSDLKSDLSSLKGKTGLVESSAGGWGDPGAKPKKDFMTSRFGIDPPEAVVSLRNDVAVSVLSCCLIPPSLAASVSDGTAQRESYRRWIQSGIAPTGRIVAAEFSRVLDVEISFEWDRLHASDVTGKSRAAKALAEIEGISVEQALMLSGLLDQDDD